MQVKGATIPVTYNFVAGGLTGPPVMMGTTLIVDGFFTGSVLSGDPSLNAVWNPVTYSDHGVIDLTTGLLNGTFTMTFANGNMLLGNLFEDVSQVIPTGGTGGAFTQTFTFTSGTGEFSGATGSLWAQVWQESADRHRGVEQSTLRRFRNRHRQRSS